MTPTLQRAAFYQNPPPHRLVDEVIWGHRLRQDQSAWHIVLEMLNVAQACLATTEGDPLPDMGAPKVPNARPPLRIRFRHLLFRFNQKAAELAAKVEAGSMSHSDAWEKWLATVQAEYTEYGGADYLPLRERFDNFTQFERAIDLVRSTVVEEADSEKNVFSSYIFPLCPEALYYEATPRKSGGLDPTFNVFTRAGTLLHIMLSRSAGLAELRPLLSSFLNRESKARELVRRLQVEEPSDSERSTPQAYLPYTSHRRFDLLAEDYIAILRLKVPDNDRFKWLVPLSALHLSLYHAEIAGECYLGKQLPLPVVCEILSHKKNIVRELSLDSLRENRDLARRAVDKFLRDRFSTPEWLSLLERERRDGRDSIVEDARSYALEQLRAQEEEANIIRDNGKTLNAFSDLLIQWFAARHKREFTDVHFYYGREAGLVHNPKTGRYRYVPTDQLLKSLVLANVAHEAKLEDFLNLLFNRYGIVLGSSQHALLAAAGYHDLAQRLSREGFRHNQTRLEARLKSMGMLRRLSDSQAYVINPLQPR